MKNQASITLLKGLEQSLDDYCELNDEGKTAFRMAITALEQPEQKKGKWIDSRDVCWLCSECGKWLDVLQGDADMNFCPNCGSRNIEEGEQE